MEEPLYEHFIKYANEILQQEGISKVIPKNLNGCKNNIECNFKITFKNICHDYNISSDFEKNKISTMLTKQQFKFFKIDFRFEFLKRLYKFCIQTDENGHKITTTNTTKQQHIYKPKQSEYIPRQFIPTHNDIL